MKRDQRGERSARLIMFNFARKPVRDQAIKSSSVDLKSQVVYQENTKHHIFKPPQISIKKVDQKKSSIIRTIKYY